MLATIRWAIATLLELIFVALIGQPRAPKRTIIIYSRFPIPGKAKTRLIPAIGADAAAELQRQMTLNIVTRARQFVAIEGTECDRIELHFRGGSERQMADWLGNDLTYVLQEGADLGEMMYNSIARSLHGGSCEVLLVGSDIPGINATVIAQAFYLLRSTKTDVILGPAADGGFYLIGAKRLPSGSLKSDVEWSTAKVLTQTVGQLEKLGVTVNASSLPVLADVDEAPELIVWAREQEIVSQQRTSLRISAVIPALNEADNIERTLRALREHASDPSQLEIIVVDGGSADDTTARAKAAGATRVLSSAASRGLQICTGASIATGEILMLLHSDTEVPRCYDDILRLALSKHPRTLCAFRLDVDDAAMRRSLALISRMANWRSHRLKFPYGDQGFCFLRSRYQSAGGIDKSLPVMEDIEFIRRWRRCGNDITLLNVAARSSPRRWVKYGVWKVTVMNWLLVSAFLLLRVSPRWLYRVYYGRSPPN